MTKMCNVHLMMKKQEHCFPCDRCVQVCTDRYNSYHGNLSQEDVGSSVIVILTVSEVKFTKMDF